MFLYEYTGTSVPDQLPGTAKRPNPDRKTVRAGYDKTICSVCEL